MENFGKMEKEMGIFFSKSANSDGEGDINTYS